MGWLEEAWSTSLKLDHVVLVKKMRVGEDVAARDHAVLPELSHIVESELRAYRSCGGYFSDMSLVGSQR